MGLDRTFVISAETKDRKPIHDIDLAERAAGAIDQRYDGWDGSLYDYGQMIINGVNWWDCQEDMDAVSKEFPNLIFTVECIGCGMSDMWIEYYHNGRSCGGDAEYPEPDYDYLLTGEISKDIHLVLTPEEIDALSLALAMAIDDCDDENGCTDDPEIITSNENTIRLCEKILHRLP